MPDSFDLGVTLTYKVKGSDALKEINIIQFRGDYSSGRGNPFEN